jgi:hypothetical protein
MRNGVVAVLVSLLTLSVAPTLKAVRSGGEHPIAEANSTVVAASDSDIEAAVGLLCKAKDRIQSKTGQASGCRVCPEGTDFRGDKMSQWELRSTTAGHFTAAKDDNLVLSGSGCDSHAMNFGGSFVFSVKSGVVRLLRYDQGLLTDQCHRFGYADGRDFLVCRGGWGGQGENDENVFMADFRASGKDRVRYLLSTMDTTGSCGGEGAGRVQESGIAGIDFEPKDSESITGLTITARLGSISCTQAQRRTEAGKSATPVKSYAIAFQFDGQRFVVTPESLAAYLRFEKR